jgi:citrate synthase
MSSLFEIKEENLDTGLRGYPCGYCTTSEVDPFKGLSYCGFFISELANKKPQEVIYLLYFGKMPNEHDIASFCKILEEKSFLSQQFQESFNNVPSNIGSMNLLSIALTLLSEFESVGKYDEDCLNLIAKIPVVAALCINKAMGWKNGVNRPDLGYIENFVNILGFPKDDIDINHLIDVFKVFNILHFDHDGGNLSTFVGKAVASGLEDLYGSLAAAMLALNGPRHGKANQDALKLVYEVHDKIKNNFNEGLVEKYISDKLKNKELIYGFGHAVLRVEDPRAKILYDMANRFYNSNSLVKIAQVMREEVVRALIKSAKVSNPYPNVDAISGVLLTVAGFNYPKVFTTIFGMSRCVGIAIQIVYERCFARNGKGTSIVRPTYFYKKRG